jgi:1-pyrroline-4-hydroxy-2-carboxylate deaminase
VHDVNLGPALKEGLAIPDLKANWHGVYPAVTTQFRDDQFLNLGATAKHVEALLTAGVHGLIMLGSVGENVTLEYKEKLEVLRSTVEQTARRVPV